MSHCCHKGDRDYYSKLGQSVYHVCAFTSKLEVKLIIYAIRSYGSWNFIILLMRCENAIRE